MSQSIIDEITKDQLKDDRGDFKVGDGVRVHLKVKEGGKTRIQVFPGMGKTLLLFSTCISGGSRHHDNLSILTTSPVDKLLVSGSWHLSSPSNYKPSFGTRRIKIEIITQSLLCCEY